MACNKISTARALSCLINTGGIRRAFIANSVDVTGVTLTSGGTVSVISMDMGTVFYQYDFQKTTGELNTTAEITLENGTKGYMSELKLRFFQNEQAHFNQLDSLVYNNSKIVVEDMNGKYFLLGKDQGNDVSALTVAWGKALNDFNGQEITFQSREALLPAELDSASVILSLL
jgi:hypothetical protein